MIALSNYSSLEKLGGVSPRYEEPNFESTDVCFVANGCSRDNALGP